MALWLRDLLNDVRLGLKLVAGHAGVESRGPVRWAHISEIPNPTPWLEGGEILLTTGLALKDNPGLQRRLIEHLDGQGSCGVGFGIGVCFDGPPVAMVKEADVRSLPLFTIPYEVPFIAITKRVSRGIFDESYAALRGAMELHRQVLASVLADGGPEGVLRAFLRDMPEFTAVLFDYYGSVLAHRPSPEWPDMIKPEELWDKLALRQLERGYSSFRWNRHTVIAASIRLREQVEGVLGLVGPRPLIEEEKLLLEHGIIGISLEFARRISVRESRRARVDEFLDEVMSATIGEQEVLRRLDRLGVLPRDGYRVLCVVYPRQVDDGSICTLVEDAASTVVLRPIVGQYDDAVFCVASSQGGDLGAAIMDAAESRGWVAVTVGLSREKYDAAAMGVAIREARFAAETSPAVSQSCVNDISNLGLPGVIAGIKHEVAPRTFVETTLGPLLDYDAKEGTELITSLQAFLRHGCRPGSAARELCIHRHTLSYRLDRIRDIAGRDPRMGEHVLEFGLALALYEKSKTI